MSVDMFGRYQSQTTRQLAEIQSSKYPDTDKDLEQNLHRLNQFVDYIAQYLQVMQKGVDQANEDAIQRMRDMAADMVVLLGGGQLLYGIDLGDLQYFLPALGAIFGFDSDKPFPISLFEMAEHFFLGYVVPLDSFIFEIQSIIDGWLVAMGVDQEFVDNMHELLSAIASVTSDTMALFQNLWDVLDVFGINTDGFGPFADLWHSVTQLLGAFNLQTLGDLTDPIFQAAAPWIHELALAVEELDTIIQAFSGGTTDLTGILNFANMFTPYLDLMATAFDPLTAWIDLFTNTILPSATNGGIPVFSQLYNLLPGLSNTAVGFLPQNIWNGVITDFLNPSGLIEAFLSPDQALNAANLFGLLDPNLIPLIGTGQISDFVANLLPNPNAAVGGLSDGGGIWSEVTDFVHGLSATSMFANADGTLIQLLSDPMTAVTPGETLDISQWVRWTGLTYTGTDVFSLGLTYYDAALNMISQPVLDTIVSPAAASANAPENNFVNLAGTHVVPAGAAWVSQTLTIPSTASAANVWWSSPALGKTDLIDQSLVKGLLDILSGFDPFGFFDASFITNIASIADIPNAKIPGLQDINNFIHQALINPNTTAGTLTDIQTNLQSLNDNIRQAADGTGQTGSIVSDIFNALNGIRSTLTASTTRLSQLESKLPTVAGSGVIGNNFMDPIERAATVGFGPGWLTLKMTGHTSDGVQSDGHNLMWVDLGNVQRIEAGIYTAGQTQTDWQSVRDTMPTLMEAPQAWTGAGPNSANGLIARSNAAGTNFVVAVRFYNAVALYYWNGATFTQIGSTQSVTPAAGARWELRAGANNDIYTYWLLMNDALVGSWIDSTHIAPVDASHRYSGEYMQSDARSNGEATPGNIGTWSVADNQPTGVIGTGLTVSRLSTATVAIASGNATAIPSGFFDTIDEQSGDITWDGQSATVRDAGWYMASSGIRLWGSGTSNGYNNIDAGVQFLRNGSARKAAGMANSGGTGGTVTQVHGSYPVQLAAGQSITPAMRVSANINIAGTADGAMSWFKLSKMNP